MAAARLKATGISPKKLRMGPNPSQAPPARRITGKCFGCNKTVTEFQISVESGDRRYHKNCLRCSSCREVLDDRFSTWHMMNFCSNDCIENFVSTRNKNSESCYACKNTLTEDTVQLGSYIWHRVCIVCFGCNRALTPENGTIYHDFPYCGNDCVERGSCASCGYPLGNRKAIIKDAPYHEEIACMKKGKKSGGNSGTSVPLCCIIM